MKKILCWFGFHEDEIEQVPVFKTKYSETSNVRWICKRCGRKTEWEGTTTFHMSIPIKASVINHK